MREESMRLKTKWIPAIAFLLVTGLLSGSAKADDPRGGEFGVLVGATLPPEQITGHFGETPSPEITLGIRGGSVFTPRLGFFADALTSSLGTVSILEDGRSYAVRAGLEIMFTPEQRNRWYLDLAAGHGNVDYGRNYYDFTYEFVSAGIGQRIEGKNHRHFRWELRADLNPTGAGPIDEWFMQVHTLAVFTWGPSGGESSGRHARGKTPPAVPAPPPDADGDGVEDAVDACPGTHPKAVVDGKGCPRDSDGDNVIDGLDRCPDTPRGALVDLRGCPLDLDRDGIPDGIDQCPDSPRDAEVGENGCPVR